MMMMHSQRQQYRRRLAWIVVRSDITYRLILFCHSMKRRTRERRRMRWRWRRRICCQIIILLYISIPKNTMRYSLKTRNTLGHSPLVVRTCLIFFLSLVFCLSYLITSSSPSPCWWWSYWLTTRATFSRIYLIGFFNQFRQNLSLLEVKIDWMENNH